MVFGDLGAARSTPVLADQTTLVRTGRTTPVLASRCAVGVPPSKFDAARAWVSRETHES